MCTHDNRSEQSAALLGIPFWQKPAVESWQKGKRNGQIESDPSLAAAGNQGFKDLFCCGSGQDGRAEQGCAAGPGLICFLTPLALGSSTICSAFHS